jgi:hypothetical protein
MNKYVFYYFSGLYFYVFCKLTASEMLKKDESELSTIKQQMEMLHFSNVQTTMSMHKLAGKR